MKISILIAALALTACSTVAPVAPAPARKDIDCRSGYHIATRDGATVCEEDGR